MRCVVFLTVNLILQLIVSMCGESRTFECEVSSVPISCCLTDRLTCKEGHAAEWQIIGRDRQPH